MWPNRADSPPHQMVHCKYQGRVLAEAIKPDVTNNNWTGILAG